MSQYTPNPKMKNLFADTLQGIPSDESFEEAEDEAGLRERSETSEHDGRGADDGWDIREPKKGS